MPNAESVSVELQGMFRDVLRDADGRITWDSGWQKNAIVTDCRRLLAGFMRGAPSTTLGIQGLRVGAGLAVWDQPPGPPPATANQVALVDPNPHIVQRANLQLAYLTGATVTATPTNRLQIVAILGPGVPPWPDTTHSTATLREFGLFGRLDGVDVLLNYRTHPAITKDPSSTLERTIWLLF
jgi:hypothetical protein